MLEWKEYGEIYDVVGVGVGGVVFGVENLVKKGNLLSNSHCVPTKLKPSEK